MLVSLIILEHLKKYLPQMEGVRSSLSSCDDYVHLAPEFIHVRELGIVRLWCDPSVLESNFSCYPQLGIILLLSSALIMLKYYQEIQAQIKDNARLRDIFEEFIDMIETEYFESALFDTLDQSFHLNIRSFILAQLSAKQPQPQAPQEESTLLSILPDPQTNQDSIFPDRTTKVPFIKVLTQINVIHQNSLIVEALKSLDFSSIPDSTATEQIESLLKLIFFEDEVFCGIPSKDLIEAASERQAAGGGLGGLGDLSKLLNMDNMDGLMKMMEQLQ